MHLIITGCISLQKCLSPNKQFPGFVRYRMYKTFTYILSLQVYLLITTYVLKILRNSTYCSKVVYYYMCKLQPIFSDQVKHSVYRQKVCCNSLYSWSCTEMYPFVFPNIHDLIWRPSKHKHIPLLPSCLVWVSIMSKLSFIFSISKNVVILFPL